MSRTVSCRACEAFNQACETFGLATKLLAKAWCLDLLIRLFGSIRARGAITKMPWLVHIFIDEANGYDHPKGFQPSNFGRALDLALALREKGSFYVCELCRKNGKSSVPDISTSPIELEAVSTVDNVVLSPPLPWGNGSRTLKKLRILCLHGFRQNASGFKGRTASFAKKLKNIAELIFIDAPHELPFIYQPRVMSEPTTNCIASSVQLSPPPSKSCNKKFAWLVEPNFNEKSDGEWKMADDPFNSLQYQQQTEGLDLSLAYLKTVFSQAGPFDGILGFSQGAAMAATICGQREKLKGEIDFRFVILCSGFALILAEYDARPINCPSLHIFGNHLGKDRQIANQASRDLAASFEEGCSVVIEHDLGHIIPTRSPFIDRIKDFLQRFL
ncbi:unnamed protein product [Ilex paraguariensis]|uniref:Serine hydrolase domain-containing protein n=1 Tax=Ilex paraguariensis TaxID=185542 RepID=A0ABC8TZ31_9AQUA